MLRPRVAGRRRAARFFLFRKKTERRAAGCRPKSPYRRLQGSSAYYPFGLRATLRRRQRRQAFVLRALGVLALLAAGWLALRQTVFRGGQPLAPAPVPTAAPRARRHARKPPMWP